MSGFVAIRAISGPLFLLDWFVCFFETLSFCVAQAGLKTPHRDSPASVPPAQTAFVFGGTLLLEPRPQDHEAQSSPWILGCCVHLGSLARVQGSRASEASTSAPGKPAGGARVTGTLAFAPGLLRGWGAVSCQQLGVGGPQGEQHTASLTLGS